MSKHSEIIEKIRDCRDPVKLEMWVKNAKRAGAQDVENAAFRQLIAVLPSVQPGTVEHALWQTIHAFEAVLKEERGKTTRLSRTRQKIERVGEKKTLEDWALSESRSQGFEMLRQRGMLELVGEAIVLRFAGEFDSHIVAAARKVFLKAGLSDQEITDLVRSQAHIPHS